MTAYLTANGLRELANVLDGLPAEFLVGVIDAGNDERVYVTSDDDGRTLVTVCDGDDLEQLS